ncbi:hypothetical protein [Butyrivibrio sp. M55]|uniref:hypothetical protein n=1 Tax=Butyrivibrio sp. M55 TaxID=1855323 RepID=UPI0008E6CB24|nr:hypothetical protein [Butyrivibrio sp. M55]SFU81708.1 hypothetical protein SAMN05216540_11178 [Butyrivibrio sp. M55]
MKRNIALVLTCLMIIGMVGCVGNDKAQDSENIGGANDAASNELETTSAGDEAQAAEAASEQATAADDDFTPYQLFLSDDLSVDGQTFLEIYAESFDDLGEKPEAYYYDVDSDGEDELLVVGPYYGFDIYDVINGEFTCLDCGGGIATICDIYAGEGKAYVVHTDFGHVGRQNIEFALYGSNGEKVESFEISAGYPDKDNYDENSMFLLNDKEITMQEYEKYLNTYKPLDRSTLKSAWD